MARAAADLRDKADDRLAAHLRGIRRRKVVRDDDARLGDRVERIFRDALEVFEHAHRNIAYVGGARLHILVIHRAEHRLKILAVDHARKLRAHALVCDLICHALDEIRVLEHHQMRVKDLRLLRADILLGLVPQRRDLRLGVFDRLQCALLLRFDVRDRIPYHSQVDVPDHERLCARETLGNADRLDFQHIFSSSTLMRLVFPVIPYNFTTLIVRYIVVFVKCI